MQVILILKKVYFLNSYLFLLKHLIHRANLVDPLHFSVGFEVKPFSFPHVLFYCWNTKTGNGNLNPIDNNKPAEFVASF